MLKERYCDEGGNLLSEYPSFHQFRYFYRKHKSLQDYYISREGIKQYQRDHRPFITLALSLKDDKSMVHGPESIRSVLEGK